MPITATTTTDLLVIDPHPNDYLHLAASMEAAEFRFLYATCGDEALRLPRQTPVALWLINSHLPDMTGVELLALVRSRDPGAACMLVGDNYCEKDELSARQLGATFYGCKPPQVEWLRALPVARKPSDRGHLAPGPPCIHVASPGVTSSAFGDSLRCKPES